MRVRRLVGSLHEFLQTGEMTKTTDPIGAVTLFEYDALGRQTKSTDALGRIVTTTYNMASEVTAVSRMFGATTISTATASYDNVGNLLSAKSISDFLKSQKIKVTPNVILSYLSFLEQAFFILKVNRQELRGKKIFEIGQKYYLEDMGLRHALLGYRSTDIGKILENIVYLHLIIAGYSVRIGKFQNKEVDFVCTRGDEKLYVQVAYLIADEAGYMSGETVAIDGAAHLRTSGAEDLLEWSEEDWQAHRAHRP